MKTEEKAGMLFDFAVAMPDGFSYADVYHRFGWHRTSFMKTVRGLRLMFAGDRITLVCEPSNRPNAPHVYRLVGTYDAARPWVTNRVTNLESQLETVHAVAMTLTNATDGRTAEGRKVRKIERTIGRLIEDLADMAEIPS